MIKKALMLLIVSLFAVAAGTGFVRGVEANFFWWMEGTEPDDYTKPPVISIVSPDNNTVTSEDSVFLSFSVDVGESETADITHLDFVSYETDWMPDNITGFSPKKPYPFVHEVNLTGIPEGTHSITVQAIEKGVYGFHIFAINSSETITFTIGTSPEAIVPEFTSWSIIHLLMAATLTAIVLGRKKH